MHRALYFAPKVNMFGFQQSALYSTLFQWATPDDERDSRESCTGGEAILLRGITNYVKSYSCKINLVTDEYKIECIKCN